jgi:hypothetical protein
MVNKILLGTGLIILSIIISIFSLSLKITGAVTGANQVSSFLGILTLIFFFVGLFILGIKKKTLEGIATAGLVGAMIIGGHGLKKAEDKYYGREKSKAKVENVVASKDEIRIDAPFKTIKGRFQRTYRWDDILDKTENKYGIPRGLLKGLIMQESYGDPTKLNEGNDGGAGLFMFMPGTAQELGLKVYEDSNRVSADTEYGKRLKELVKEQDSDYGKLAKIDERFHPEKAADAAGKFLKKLYEKHGSWEKAISAYNRGSTNVAKNPLNQPHVQKVLEFQDYYNKHDPD